MDSRTDSQVDQVYFERNQLVAALARMYPSGVRKTEIEGWDAEWHTCVFIDLPTGQASWHFHDRDVWLLEGLPVYTKPWDGHTTGEKYRRVAGLYERQSYKDPTPPLARRCPCHSLTTPDPLCRVHGRR